MQELGAISNIHVKRKKVAVGSSLLDSMASPATSLHKLKILGMNSVLLCKPNVQCSSSWLPQDIYATTASLGIYCHSGHQLTCQHEWDKISKGLIPTRKTQVSNSY